MNLFLHTQFTWHNEMHGMEEVTSFFKVKGFKGAPTLEELYSDPKFSPDYS